MRAIAEKQAELNNLAADFSKRRQEGTFVRGSDGTSQQQTFGRDQMGESLQFTVYDGPSDVSEGAARATASFKSAAPGSTLKKSSSTAKKTTYARKKLAAQNSLNTAAGSASFIETTPAGAAQKISTGAALDAGFPEPAKKVVRATTAKS